jgi:hypothetical protein
LIAEPVALRIADGVVVDVVVEGTVEALDLEPDLGGELAPLESVPVDDPATVVVDVEP